MKVKTAILPVAGLGTRVLPLSMHQPKAMIGIVDRPMIHYVMEEVAAAGINNIIIVTGPDQPEFQKYADYLRHDPAWPGSRLKIGFAVQEKPYGNGDAVFAAKKYLADEPFVVCFSDDLLADNPPPLKTFVEVFEKVNAPLVMLEPVPQALVSRYGVVKAQKSELAKGLYAISDVVEKPRAEEAPSNLTIIGRYVLTPAILEELSKLYPVNGKEIGLAEALKNYAARGEKLYGWHFPGKRFDAGSKMGILKAQAYFGTRHRELGEEFSGYLKDLV